MRATSRWCSPRADHPLTPSWARRGHRGARPDFPLLAKEGVRGWSPTRPTQGSGSVCWRAIFCALWLTAAHAELTEVQLGQGFWRAQATLLEPQRKVRADGYSLTLAAPTAVEIRFRSRCALGLAVLVEHEGAPQGQQVAALGRDGVLARTLPAGRYLLMAAGKPDADGCYLLTVTRPQPAAGTFAALAPRSDEPPAPFLGSWRLPPKPQGLAMGAERRWVVWHDGQQVFVGDLDTRTWRRIEAEPGAIRRVACGPEGWNLLVVSAGGARLFALPEAVPFARFVAQTGVADAVFVGPDQRLAVLPVGGNVYVTSPVPDDLAFVPNSAGEALAGDPLGEKLAVRFGAQDVAVIDAQSRRAFGKTRWGADLRAVALHPQEPALAGAAPGATRLWRAVAGIGSQDLPDLVGLDFSPDGVLAGADGKAVRLFALGKPIGLTPAFPATLVSWAPDGGCLAALAPDGSLGLWLTGGKLEPPRTSPALNEARKAYSDGYAAFGKADWPTARALFVKVRELLAKVERDAELEQVLCLSWLRSSQASYMAKDYPASLAEAEALVAAAERLAPDVQKFYRSMGLYRQGDALWELRRWAEAKERFRAALDKGLEGPAADDARKRLAEDPPV